MALTDQELVAMAEEVYAIRQEVRRLEAAAKGQRERAEQIERAVEDDMGKGGAVLIHDGRTVAFIGQARRTVNQDAIDAAAEQLPSSVQPRDVVTRKYPTVSALEKVERTLAAKGIPVDTLVTTGKAGRLNFREAEADG